VPALTLHWQLKTSNRFLEIRIGSPGDELQLPDQPRPVLLCVAPDPSARLRDIAASLDITERSASSPT
jgi:hypothetical protein